MAKRLRVKAETAEPGTEGGRSSAMTSGLLGRRDFLVTLAQMGAVAGLAACGSGSDIDTRPLALVYRGPASTSGCPEAVAALLGSGPVSFRTAFIGPDEDLELSAKNLKQATVYAQPGGGEVEAAWRKLRQHADEIREWVHGGGHYLGFCLGAYLAGASPGFGLLPGDTSQYIASKNATVSDTSSSLVSVNWRGQPRTMFFQDGPLFRLPYGADALTLATYENDMPAAVVASYGAGRIGVVGPHPEADQSWYRDSKLTAPEGIQFDLGYDLIRTTVSKTPLVSATI